MSLVQILWLQAILSQVYGMLVEQRKRELKLHFCFCIIRVIYFIRYLKMGHTIMKCTRCGSNSIFCTKNIFVKISKNSHSTFRELFACFYMLHSVYSKLARKSSKIFFRYVDIFNIFSTERGS